MTKRALLLLFFLFGVSLSFAQQKVIRVNQLGYLPQSVKVAVFLSSEAQDAGEFQVLEALTGKPVYEAEVKHSNGSDWGMKTAFRLDFSAVTKSGGYYLKLGETHSPAFQIATDVYNGTADFLLKYMRQQRCGFNPYLQDSCHLHDGIIVDHPTKTGKKIDVTGGWHDASDYLQYLTTSANATYQLLYAYQQNPTVFNDDYKGNGLPGANGIPDILDEAKWGLDWMVKMNPLAGEMYNQIADDRDHRGYRLPNKDTVSYGLEGTYRPVYFITGNSQGLAEHKNRTTGVSSSAAKYASSFALGAMMIKKYYPEFAKQIERKAAEAYTFALSDLGACQTACNVSPYFYEEANYVDDVELAATTLYQLTGNEYYLAEAKKWGSVENVTPWMSTGFARHYQFYPFVNLGHVFLAQKDENFADYLKQGLTHIYDRGKDDPFLNGIPFIWCSNNLVAAALTQARTYEEITGDYTFVEMEAALRDWLFGCNPWGTSMICGLPAGGDNPELPHSSITKILGETTYGGLVDGPISNTLFSSLIGINIQQPDPLEDFNMGKAVYHDDMGDYSSNEPTMDGTASLSYYLSSLEELGIDQHNEYEKDGQGAIRRINPSEKNIYLIFSAHDKAEGAAHILKVLNKKNCKASFFFTGDFLRDKQFQSTIKKVVKNGHYFGAHSDKHLLYCDWTKRDSLLVDRFTFNRDLKNNYKVLQQHGISIDDASWFLPPYEWYNAATVNWAGALGLKTVNFSPGIRSNADYTTPDMKNYLSSNQIIKSIFQVEEEQGLNGAVVLIHPGTEAKRTDKFYLRLEELIEKLQTKGYRFKRLP
ncbi:glycoside hydrolase family 9 protein [Draconibacterium halophilum]|uniref:Polysaccharide deacetylase family protein n=1 Tax=Draconibacterium halophilum TaxID=2706887 RepID=A0A6C0RCV1_9BACT|nr:glycoside hydrolase family 9 protein [Draconibacterium halophilum]QIA07887.1 polysaccharide deacetylase family protein [Draconibacterium halophilum]